MKVDPDVLTADFRSRSAAFANERNRLEIYMFARFHKALSRRREVCVALGCAVRILDFRETCRMKCSKRHSEATEQWHLEMNDDLVRLRYCHFESFNARCPLRHNFYQRRRGTSADPPNLAVICGEL